MYAMCMGTFGVCFIFLVRMILMNVKITSMTTSMLYCSLFNASE